MSYFKQLLNCYALHAKYPGKGYASLRNISQNLSNIFIYKFTLYFENSFYKVTRL